MNSLLVLIVCLCFSIYSKGQIYTALSGGYGIPTASVSIMETDAPSSDYMDELLKGTFGKGTNFGLLFGIHLNENIGAELNINYLLGSSLTAKNHHAGTNADEYSEDALKATMVRIFPAIRITTAAKKINVYSKLGFLIGFGATLEETSYERSEYSFPTHTTVFEESESAEYKGGISTGFTGALGITIALKNNLSLFAEASLMANSWAPTRRTVTKYVFNGQDQLSMLPASERETEFVDTIEEVYVEDPTYPSRNLKIYFPMSAVYFNLGLQYSFGKSQKAN